MSGLIINEMKNHAQPLRPLELATANTRKLKITHKGNKSNCSIIIKMFIMTSVKFNS